MSWIWTDKHRSPGHYIKRESNPSWGNIPGNTGKAALSFNFGRFYFSSTFPNTSAHAVIWCVLLVSHCVSFYISINICRRPPNTSLLLKAAQKKKEKNRPKNREIYWTPFCLPPAIHAHTPCVSPPHTYTHWPFTLSADFPADLWGTPLVNNLFLCGAQLLSRK